MYQVSKRERAMLYREANASRMFYRMVCAAAPAALVVLAVLAGFMVLAK